VCFSYTDFQKFVSDFALLLISATWNVIPYSLSLTHLLSHTVIGQIEIPLYLSSDCLANTAVVIIIVVKVDLHSASQVTCRPTRHHFVTETEPLGRFRSPPIACKYRPAQ